VRITISTGRTRYSAFMIILHWTTAVLVIGAYIFSEGARKVRVAPPTLHFTFGLAVLLLVVPRLIGRAARRTSRRIGAMASLCAS
jgi:cytochrome b561